MACKLSVITDGSVQVCAQTSLGTMVVGNLHSRIHSLCLPSCATSAPAWCYKFALPLGNTVYQSVFLIKVKRVNVDGGDLVFEEMKGMTGGLHVFWK